MAYAIPLTTDTSLREGDYGKATGLVQPVPSQKSCSKCGMVKSIDEFYLDKSKQYRPRSQCKRCETERSIKNYKNRAPSSEQLKERRKGARVKLIADLGGKCVCCDEETYEFLQIDHVNNDGNEHRKDLGRSLCPSDYYAVGLENFQVLCANCHNAKSFHGDCPCSTRIKR